jgi:hypothetical protein
MMKSQYKWWKLVSGPLDHKYIKQQIMKKMSSFLLYINIMIHLMLCYMYGMLYLSNVIYNQKYIMQRGYV